MASRALFALPGAALGLIVALSAPTAEATIVERVVAVVGERAILLSDLRDRARPYLLQIERRIPGEAAQAAQRSQMFRMLLEKMVDEELERRAANGARITVTAREIDESIERIAQQQGLGYEAIVDEAIRSGMTESEYRQEIRRQVLEAKLMNLRVVARVRITEEDLRTAYRRIVMEERERLPFRAAWIRIDAPRGPEGDARQKLAQRLARSARTGADFAELARKHSNDARTRPTGGLLPPLQPGQLPPALDKVALALEVGEVSRPVRVADSLFVLQLVERSPSELPSFQHAQDELRQRVYLEKMDRARRHWLDGLRRRTHVDVRL